MEQTPKPKSAAEVIREKREQQRQKALKRSADEAINDDRIQHHEAHPTKDINGAGRKGGEVVRRRVETRAKASEVQQKINAKTQREFQEPQESTVPDPDPQSCLEVHHKLPEGQQSSWTFPTWNAKDGSVINSSQRQVTLQMRENQKLFILGTFDLEVQSGAVSIYGAKLREGTNHRVYCPSTHSIPGLFCLDEARVVIREVEETMGSLGEVSMLFKRRWTATEEAPGNSVAEDPMAPTEYDELSDDTDDQDLSYSDEDGMESETARPRVRQAIQDPVPKTNNLMPKSSSEDYTRFDVSRSYAFIDLARSLEDQYRRTFMPLDIGPWNEYLSAIPDLGSPVVFVLGAKHSGKSTFSRCLLNGVVTKHSTPTAVYYMDLDPVCPEYTTHGQLTLVRVREPNLGPPFTHPSPECSFANTVIKALPFPSRESVVNNPSYWFACLEELVKAYLYERRQAGHASLIISAPNLAIKAHIEFLMQAIGLVPQLTHLVYLRDKEAEELEGRFDQINSVPTRLKEYCKKNSSAYFEALAVSKIALRYPGVLKPLTAHQAQHMQMVSYMCASKRDSAASGDSSVISWTASHLLDLPRTYVGLDPVSLAPGTLKPIPPSLRIHAVLCPSTFVSEFTLRDILHLSVVKIVSQEAPQSSDQSTTTTAADSKNDIRIDPKTRIPYFPPHQHRIPYPNPSTSTVIGTAVLDLDTGIRGTVGLILPAHSRLPLLHAAYDGRKILLVHGTQGLPAWLLFDEELARTTRAASAAAAGGDVAPERTAHVLRREDFGRHWEEWERLNVRGRVRRFKAAGSGAK